MDQDHDDRVDLGWWASVVFAGWRQRPGPRYQRIADALLDAIERRIVTDGTRVPSERVLAAVLGVSRGTVVACLEQLATAGVVARRQGSGTQVVGRRSWTAPSLGHGVSRRAMDAEAGIDLSASLPRDLRHLPQIDPGQAWSQLDGHGIEPAGLPVLREAVARHLSEHQQLPTTPDQILITNGAQEALWLLAQVLAPHHADLITTCPTYPGLPAAATSGQRRLVTVPAGPDGPDAAALARAARGGGIVYLMPSGHNPTGAVIPMLPRQALAALADTGPATIIEDLTLADLYLDAPPPPPAAALSPSVVGIGSTSKLLWGGLRIGWIRADPPLREAAVSCKSSTNLATSPLAQVVAAGLLDAIDRDWLDAHRAALVRRRDHLAGQLERRLPAWRVDRPAAGLSLWITIPVDNPDAFAHTADSFGVTVLSGSRACLDGQHQRHIRLSFAEQLDTLTAAADRLTAAWHAHAETLAATPARPGRT